MTTNNTSAQAAGIAVVSEHDFDIDVPVLTGLQRQGDVLVLPAAVTASTAVPEGGTPVVRSENGGNMHAVYAADGPVYCDTNTAEDLQVGTLTVPAGSTAYLSHPEHGYLGIGPGSYEIRRQREMAGAARMVAD